MLMVVKIRFNTNYPSKSQYEWRLIVEGEEQLVNSIRVEVPCFTTSEFIEGHGQKYHLSCDANNVEVQNILNKKQATIK